MDFLKMECSASTLTLTLGTASTAELSAVGTGRTLPPRKFVKIEIVNWKMDKARPGILQFYRATMLFKIQIYWNMASRRIPNSDVLGELTASIFRV
jgi:hypothetical protein